MGKRKQRHFAWREKFLGRFLFWKETWLRETPSEKLICGRRVRQTVAAMSTWNKYIAGRSLPHVKGSDCGSNERVPSTLMNKWRFANEITKRKGYHLLKCAKS